MSFYECVFILRQDIAVQDMRKVAGEIENYIVSLKSEKNKDFLVPEVDADAKIITKEYWGFRKLAYKIRKNERGHYLFYQIQCPSDKVDSIYKKFKLNQNIIDYKVFKYKTLTPTPTEMMKAPSERV